MVNFCTFTCKRQAKNWTKKTDWQFVTPSSSTAHVRIAFPWGRSLGQPGKYVGENKGMDLWTWGEKNFRYDFIFKCNGKRGGGDSKFSKIANFVLYVRFHRLFPPGIFNFVPFILQSPWLARGFRPWHKHIIKWHKQSIFRFFIGLFYCIRKTNYVFSNTPVWLVEIRVRGDRSCYVGRLGLETRI